MNRIRKGAFLSAALVAAVLAMNAAETLRAFGRDWSVRTPSDWKLEQENGEVLRLVQGREPPPGPRRPTQFALTPVPAYSRLTVEADVRPLGRSLMIVFAYRDEAHFDYAHLSTDTGAQQPVHNGIFHVYGGERVRISTEQGPAAFPVNRRWCHAVLTHDPAAGTVSVTVDGKELPALKAVDLSLGPGQVGIGSFDETADFKNLKITAAPSAAGR